MQERHGRPEDHQDRSQGQRTGVSAEGCAEAERFGQVQVGRTRTAVLGRYSTSVAPPHY